MMNRRAFVIGLGTLLVAPLAARGQQAGKMARIGWLSSGGVERNSRFVATFRQGLKELGYVEGKDVFFEERYAEGQFEKLPALAADLIRLKSDVLVVEGTPAAQAAKTASSVIPIVMTLVADPVGDGLVTSLAQPGGNVTGFSVSVSQLADKRLQLLTEAVPSVSPVAVLSNPGNMTTQPQLKVILAAAPSLRVTILPFEAGRGGDIAPAFVAMRKEHVGGLLVLADPFFGVHARKIIELSAQSRLPAVYPERRWPDAGGLMSYGTSFEALFRRAAVYVDRILKGAKPADLPVEQPTKFELVINLKTARTLGLTIPPSLLLRADQVIE
jgi:putative tryptophan/tyrosine transport system substrate-binding protein